MILTRTDGINAKISYYLVNFKGFMEKGGVHVMRFRILRINKFSYLKFFSHITLSDILFCIAD